MIKMCEYILLSFLLGMLTSLLLNKVISLREILQGVVTRFDKFMTGNDGNYSNTRLTELIWAIGSLFLIYTCVLRQITIQEGILMLIGGAIGITGIKGVFNKMTEAKDSINKKGDSDAGQA